MLHLDARIIGEMGLRFRVWDAGQHAYVTNSLDRVQVGDRLSAIIARCAACPIRLADIGDALDAWIDAAEKSGTNDPSHITGLESDWRVEWDIDPVVTTENPGPITESRWAFSLADQLLKRMREQAVGATANDFPAHVWEFLTRQHIVTGLTAHRSMHLKFHRGHRYDRSENGCATATEALLIAKYLREHWSHAVRVTYRVPRGTTEVNLSFYAR